MIKDFLYAPTEGEPSGAPAAGVPPADTAAHPPAGQPDLSRQMADLMNAVNSFNQRFSDLDKRFSDNFAAINRSVRDVVDDLVEGGVGSGNNQPAAQPAASQAAPPAPSITPSGSSIDPTQLASSLEMVAYKRRMKEAQEEARAKDALLEQTARELRQTRIESAINAAISKHAWAEGVTDLVAHDLMSKADIDTDGKIKIGGQDPKIFVENFYNANRWAQPAPINSGSGNAGGAPRRPDGQIDLANYNPAKVNPDSDDFRRLIDQAKRSIGLAT